MGRGPTSGEPKPDPCVLLMTAGKIRRVTEKEKRQEREQGRGGDRCLPTLSVQEKQPALVKSWRRVRVGLL